jgi:hypothetical protein
MRWKLMIFMSALAVSAEAAAATYEDLEKDGYATSRLTLLPSGSHGWYMTKGDSRYFCKMGSGLIRKGNRVGNFLTNGHFFSVTIAQYLRTERGQSPDTMPLYPDIVSGRAIASRVGACVRQRT